MTVVTRAPTLRTMRAWPPHALAVVCGAAYFVYAVASAGRLPFGSFPMFTFPSAHGRTAVPMFRAAGGRAVIEDYEAFSGIGPDDVDLTHGGYPCSVEHMFQEERAWLATHRASAPTPGDVPCELGLTLVSIDARGEVSIEDRVDASGRCRPR